MMKNQNFTKNDYKDKDSDLKDITKMKIDFIALV